MVNEKGSEAKPIHEQMQEMNTSLRQMSNALGFFTIQMSEYKDKNDTEKILFLNSRGFDKPSIASIVGTTPATVNARLAEAKKKKKKKK
ncbi:MAG: hypothetical protein IIA89_10105 [Chloroflexi bacterium]|nr:hypothetical protein [Chloroflexota bacterium]